MRALIPILVFALGLPAMAGPVAAQDDDEPRYLLPAPAGDALRVTAGNNNTTGRRGNERFAFDFAAAAVPSDDTVEPDAEEEDEFDEATDDVDPAFTVVAARGGTVLGQRPSVADGRCPQRSSGPRPDCWRAVNYVVIDHGDGTSGLYLHLRRGSTLVRRGDIVSAGTPIGVAGQSGWTNGIGLQFQVEETPSRADIGQPGWFLTRSLPVTFSDPSVTDAALDRRAAHRRRRRIGQRARRSVAVQADAPAGGPARVRAPHVGRQPRHHGCVRP